MPIVNYVLEHTRFMEYATDEHLTASERLLWYALMHVMNQRAQGNIWPDEFIRISNDRLLSYCPMKFDTMANARNGLKQRGLIEFTKGDKNRMSPSYRMIYFYPQYVQPETERDGLRYPKKSDNTGGNTGDNMGGNTGDNTGGNSGDLYINSNRNQTDTGNQSPELHTQKDTATGANGARAGGYTSLDGQEHPARYDSAWMGSPRARGAVAQRILDGMGGDPDAFQNEHQRILDMLARGTPPELIEDAAERCAGGRGAKLAFAEQTAAAMGYTEEAHEYRRCLAMANGNERLAQSLLALRKEKPEDETA